VIRHEISEKLNKKGGGKVRARNFWLVVALAFIVDMVLLCPANAETQTPQKPLGDSTLYEEDIWIVLIDEPEFHFQKAHEFFLKKDFKAAASEIRKGAAFLKLEAGRSTAEGRKTLMASASELGKLANDVEKGIVTSEGELKDAFTRADFALANHHNMTASEYWAKKDAKKTGYALKAAAQALEQAAEWSDHKLETTATDIIKVAREGAGKLIESTGWTPEEARILEKGIKDLGNEILKLGNDIEPKKK
jgi:hypothetical protein